METKKKILKICVTGGESVGKTTLSRKLAEHFGCQWILEFAREYLEGRDLEQNPVVAIDFEIIAEGQLELIKKAEESIDNANETVPRLIFCDTDALITELWSKFLIGSVPEKVKRLAQTQSPYHLHLLLDPTVPYEPDPLRFIPEEDQRWKFHHELLGELKKRKFVFVTLDGSLEERLAKAVKEVCRLIDGESW